MFFFFALNTISCGDLKATAEPIKENATAAANALVTPSAAPDAPIQSLPASPKSNADPYPTVDYSDAPVASSLVSEFSTVEKKNFVRVTESDEEIMELNFPIVQENQFVLYISIEKGSGVVTKKVNHDLIGTFTFEMAINKIEKVRDNSLSKRIANLFNKRRTIVSSELKKLANEKESQYENLITQTKINAFINKKKLVAEIGKGKIFYLKMEVGRAHFVTEMIQINKEGKITVIRTPGEILEKMEQALVSLAEKTKEGKKKLLDVVKKVTDFKKSKVVKQADKVAEDPKKTAESVVEKEAKPGDATISGKIASAGMSVVDTVVKAKDDIVTKAHEIAPEDSHKRTMLYVMIGVGLLLALIAAIALVKCVFGKCK